MGGETVPFRCQSDPSTEDKVSLSGPWFLFLHMHHDIMALGSDMHNYIYNNHIYMHKHTHIHPTYIYIFIHTYTLTTHT